MREVDPLLQDISETLSLLSDRTYDVDDQSVAVRLRELERELSARLTDLLDKTTSPRTDAKGYEQAESAAKHAVDRMQKFAKDASRAKESLEAVEKLIGALAGLRVLAM